MGRLAIGDYIVAGAEWGRVRALRDTHGSSLDAAGPSKVVEVVGFRGHPAAGEDLYVVPTEKIAVSIAAKVAERREKKMTTQSIGAQFTCVTSTKSTNADADGAGGWVLEKLRCSFYSLY
jgi:translation initiation factor IF-2